ncbi:class III extradiol ring-cleavage dioxygenase [Paraburkholderia sediminicola]|uniref:Class III extradiol ring-cleavage dioxygenase n=2 Tax=Burkholderiaceae TaxID=119060 RepID=A0ABW9E3V8_9BURK
MRATWKQLEDYLGDLASTLSELPLALVVVSGHWEEAVPTVNISPAPPLLFDYFGFPDYTYRLTWPAPGAPEIAERVCALLGRAGFWSAVNDRRGYDHGVFIPLKVVFPDAEIPVVQLSLQRGLDPATHLEIGRALKPLRDQGVLIIGSGQTYHNMRGFGGSEPDLKAEAFDTWLREAITATDTRDQSLIDWERAPGARDAQPHEDHLLPLMVAAGAASGEAAIVDFHGHALGKPISGFRFG